MHYKIIKKSQFLLFWLAPTMATTITNIIFMPDKWYVMPEIEKEALLRHELEHVKQWEKDGIGIASYLLSKQKRREYELEAYKVQIDYLMAHNFHPNIDSWAKIMSQNYWPLKWINFEEAREMLKLWIRT